MKKISLKVMSAIVAASLLVPAISPSASEVKAKAETKIQSYKKSEEWKQNKDEITSKKDTIKKNHEANKSLREEISKKRDNIKNLRKEIKDGDKKIAEEDLAKIKSQVKTVKDDTSKLEELRGVIKKDTEVVKEDLKNKNFDDAKTQLDNIISTQNSRTDDLKKLSSDLNALTSIIQTAIANAKTK